MPAWVALAGRGGGPFDGGCMAGRVREDREVPRIGTLDRDVYVREIARTMIDALPDVDEDNGPLVEQFLCGVVHYLLGRIHDRPEYPRVNAKWRGKAPLIPLINGLLVRQRETMGDSQEALRKWLETLGAECDVGKFNPLAARSFAALLRSPPKQAAMVMDRAERALRREMGLPV